MLHAEATVITVRLFADGRQYGEPYEAVATISLCGDVAFLVGLHGTVTRQHWSDIQGELRRLGVRDLLSVRHGERVWYDVASGKSTRGRWPVVV